MRGRVEDRACYQGGRQGREGPVGRQRQLLAVERDLGRLHPGGGGERRELVRLEGRDWAFFFLLLAQPTTLQVDLAGAGLGIWL